MSANHRYTLKVITLGRDPIRNICVRIRVDLYNSYSEKSRMCQPFLVKDGHLRFPIHKKVTTLGPDPIKNMCTKFGVDP